MQMRCQGTAGHDQSSHNRAAARSYGRIKHGFVRLRNYRKRTTITCIVPIQLFDDLPRDVWACLCGRDIDEEVIFVTYVHSLVKPDGEQCRMSFVCLGDDVEFSRGGVYSERPVTLSNFTTELKALAQVSSPAR